MTRRLKRGLMIRWVWSVVVAVASIAVGAGSASAQQTVSRCADCHLSRPDAPGGRHVSDWD